MIPPPPPPVPLSQEAIPPLSSASASLPKLKLIRNDYCEVFCQTGGKEVPQNFIRDFETSVRFAKYPRWERLLQAKDLVRRARAHPPVGIRCDLKQFKLGRQLNTKFDVILIDPPWKEYVDRTPGVGAAEGGASKKRLFWSLDDLKELEIDEIAETPSWIFLWAGDTHLDDARELLAHWGCRRCEDITWLKSSPTEISSCFFSSKPSTTSDRSNINSILAADDCSREMTTRSVVFGNEEENLKVVYGTESNDAVVKRVKEHCLMGLKGLVRRSTDTHLVHANIDTDVIVAPLPLGKDEAMPELLSTAKPSEIYEIIERFCLGRKKLELFATSPRAGWLSLGNSPLLEIYNIEKRNGENLDLSKYLSWFEDVIPTSAQNSAASLLAAPSVPPPPPSQLADPNSYPQLTTFKGGRYEGTSQSKLFFLVEIFKPLSVLESLRPKSPSWKGASGGS